MAYKNKLIIDCKLTDEEREAFRRKWEATYTGLPKQPSLFDECRRALRGMMKQVRRMLPKKEPKP